MKEETPVDVAALAEQPEAAESNVEETKPVECAAAEADEVVDAAGDEGGEERPEAELSADECAAKVEGETSEQDEPVAELSRSEFLRIVDEFGAEIATKIVRDGGGYEAALRLAYDAARSESETLRGRVAELEANMVKGGQARSYKNKKRRADARLPLPTRHWSLSIKPRGAPVHRRSNPGSAAQKGAGTG